ncbi:MAG: RecQ family ATP-dependent DNA helicase [Saprospiraceae bacterium]|nr:RecQ family ATP-dependent DNA helicase [Saprospiraceae bacterium]
MDPHAVLKKYWGFSEFRPLQYEIIESVLSEKDTLALLPTGGGKSICFQVPALCKEGICIVISPLIALMKDQVENLKKKGIRAEAIYSGMSYREIDIILDNAVFGGLKFLYLSPERLLNDVFLTRFPKMHVNLIAVDEAHCISQWGYDFRPSYLDIAQIKPFQPNVPILALTATATDEVVKDIQHKLDFKIENVFKKSFERSNLRYVVLYNEAKENKLVEILSKVHGSTIIYVRNRRKTKELAHWLHSRSISVGSYHAGMSLEERGKIQELWIKNKIRVIVSTNAFGMGIDKPDVRLVIHIDLPDSPEAYFQEAGRAGRDEKNALAIVLFDQKDINDLKSNISSSFPSFEDIKSVYTCIFNFYQIPIGSGKGVEEKIDLVNLSTKYHLSSQLINNVLKILEKNEWWFTNDAFKNPAKIYISASKEQLYDAQLKSKEIDLLIKALVRAIPGIFQQYSVIPVNQITHSLKITEGQLFQMLTALEKLNLIEFSKPNSDSTITFLKERVPTENLTIDHEKYQFLKSKAIYRADVMINYVLSDVCRSNYLVKYFGEKPTKTCGICDVCLRNKPITLTEEEMLEQILTKVKSKKFTIQNLLLTFPLNSRATISDLIAHLIDDGHLSLNEEHTLIVNGK